jgi:hypothetical protein
LLNGFAGQKPLLNLIWSFEGKVKNAWRVFFPEGYKMDKNQREKYGKYLIEKLIDLGKK